MYITHDLNWTLIPTIAIGFNGNRKINYQLRVVVSWLRWQIHFGWYEGNLNKLPF